jgi:iron-sulfur cluster assembly accessory protein
VPNAEPEDILIGRAGAKVLVDSFSLTYLAGSEIDYVDDLMSASFKIKNPNATAACGCGTSFSV